MTHNKKLQRHAPAELLSARTAIVALRMPAAGGYASLDETPALSMPAGEEHLSSPRSYGHGNGHAGPHSPTHAGPHSPRGLSRHGSTHSLSGEDLAHFNPLDELAGFFEAQLEKRNPQVSKLQITFRNNRLCTAAAARHPAVRSNHAAWKCLDCTSNSPSTAGCCQGEGIS